MRTMILMTLAASAIACVAALAGDGKAPRNTANSNNKLPAKRAADDLIKITKKRIPMDKRLVRFCAAPHDAVGPHEAAEVDIYVNAAVIEYRQKHKESFSYPIGSKFVKQKYPRIGAKSPDIATVMLKKANTGKVSDWEFSMVRSSDNKPLSIRSRSSCADCHEQFESRGYVSRESEGALRLYLDSMQKP